MHRFCPASVLCAAGLAAAPSLAQETLNHPTGQTVGYTLDSGATSNDTDHVARVFSSFVTVDNAAWLRLQFSASDLPDGSYLVITSALDGERQRLDAAGLRMWSDATAYFNGNAVVLELFAAPHTKANRVAMEHLTALLGPVADGGPGQCGICGTDDRTPANQDYSCRLMTVGCTASVFCEDSTMVSAGHCISGTLVAQFRVPASTASCATVNPPVDDQFPVISTQQVNGGVGNDWSVLSVGTNGLGQRPFQRYGALRRIATAPAPVASPCSFNGFGVDLTCTRSQTQQFSNGAITVVESGDYQLNADVRGGNSGSGLIVNNQIVGVVTHCSSGCPNFASRVDLPAFAAARNAMALCDNSFVLGVSSAGAASVPIEVSPADNFGFANGATNFNRTYNFFTHVTLTAPPLASGHQFQRWTLGGVNQPTGQTVAVLDISGATTAVATYGAGCYANCDGSTAAPVLTVQDFACFLNAYAAGQSYANCDLSAAVPVLTVQDFACFLNAYAAGCP